MNHSRALRKAQKTIRRGLTTEAIQMLREIAAGGEHAACASLAELLAFKGEWNELIPNAARLIAHSDTVYAGNVFDDMIRLLGRAGQETGRWLDIEEAARTAAAMIQQRERREQVRDSQLRILDRLTQYARSRGAPQHELLPLWAAPAPHLSEAKKMRLIEEDLARAIEHRPKLREDANAYAMHLFLIALRHDMPELALANYHAHTGPLSFDYTVCVAAHLASTGRENEAWALLQAPKGAWWPVDHAQVAPVALLIEPQLRRIMTRDHCEEVLNKPRGPEIPKATATSS